MIDEKLMNKLYKLANALVNHSNRRQAYIRKVNKEYDRKLRLLSKTRDEEFKDIFIDCKFIYYLSYGGERAAEELRVIKEKYAGLLPDEFYDFYRLATLLHGIEKYHPDSIEEAIANYNTYCCDLIFHPID